VEDGETLMDGLPERFAEQIQPLEVDAVGGNCIVGPQRMLDIVRMMAQATELPISAMPTPGLPQLVRGQVVYDIHPDYFGKYAARLVEAGAAIVGGCCGTTPDHTRAVAPVRPRREDQAAHSRRRAHARTNLQRGTAHRRTVASVAIARQRARDYRRTRPAARD
jgi:hypothetical protein